MICQRISVHLGGFVGAETEFEFCAFSVSPGTSHFFWAEEFGHWYGNFPWATFSFIVVTDTKYFALTLESTPSILGGTT